MWFASHHPIHNTQHPKKQLSSPLPCLFPLSLRMSAIPLGHTAFSWQSKEPCPLGHTDYTCTVFSSPPFLGPLPPECWCFDFHGNNTFPFRTNPLFLHIFFGVVVTQGAESTRAKSKKNRWHCVLDYCPFTPATNPPR